MISITASIEMEFTRVPIPSHVAKITDDDDGNGFFNGQPILAMRVLQGASEMFSCGGDKTNDAKEPLGALEVGEKRELLPDTKNLHLLCSGDHNHQ